VKLDFNEYFRHFYVSIIKMHLSAVVVLFGVLYLACSTSIVLQGKGSMRCFNQKVDSGNDVSISYVVSGEKEHNVITTVMDTRGLIAYNNPPMTREGKFEAKASSSGVYRLCFQSKDASPKSISFDFYLQDGLQEEKMATQDEINPIRSNFRRLSRNLDTVYRNIQFYERREKTHRDLAEQTCDRVLFSGLIKIVVLFLVSIGQAYILRGFFNNKPANSV
jgi:hypothetical protein